MTSTMGKRPTIVACLAASIDGRIHPAETDGYAQLGSHWDIDHLQACRDEADVVLIGGETFRQYPSLHQGHRKTPWVCVLTTGGDGVCQAISPEAPLFHSDDALPVVLFTRFPVSESDQQRYPSHVDVITIGDSPEAMLAVFRQRGATRALCEGGGQVVAWLLAHQCLDGLWLTVTPQLLGSAGTPLVGVLSTNHHAAPQCTLRQERVIHCQGRGTERIQYWGIAYP